MSDDARVWRLVDGQGLVAELVVTGGDFPWLNADVRPTERFEGVRPLFEEELRWLGRPGDPAGWEAAYNRIRQAVRLLAPDGQPVPEFLRLDAGTRGTEPPPRATPPTSGWPPQAP